MSFIFPYFVFIHPENTLVKGIQMSEFEANQIPETAKRLAQEWLDSIFEHLDRENEELTREAELSSTKYSLK